MIIDGKQIEKYRLVKKDGVTLIHRTTRPLFIGEVIIIDGRRQIVNIDWIDEVDEKKKEQVIKKGLCFMRSHDYKERQNKLTNKLP